MLSQITCTRALLSSRALLCLSKFSLGSDGNPLSSLLPPCSRLLAAHQKCEKKRKRNGGNGKETVSKRNEKETVKKRKRNGKETKRNRFKRNEKETLSSFLLTLSIYLYIYREREMDNYQNKHRLTGDVSSAKKNG